MANLFLTPDKQKLSLKCTFDQRNIAKKAGGTWNPSLKSWDFAIDLNVYEDIKNAFKNNLIIDGDAQDAINNRKIQVDTIRKFKEESKKNEDINYNVIGLSLDGKNPLYPYQKHGVRCGTVSNGGFLIADQMGLGKTIQGIGIALNKKHFYGARSCLVVCPAVVKYNWLNQIQKFTNEKALVIDGKVEERYEKWFAPGYFFKIVNYEILARDLFYFEKVDKNGKVTSKDNRIPNHEQIINNYFGIMIMDQMHYIQSHSAQRTLACKGMKVKAKIGLTGTPIDGRLQGFHSIMECIKPGLFPTRAKFLDRYAIFDHWGGIKSYVRVNEFKEKIEPYYIRRLKEDVLQNLPPMIFQNAYVELSTKAMKEYNKIARRQHDLTMLEEMIVTIIRCRQFCDMPDILGLDIESDKLKVLQQLLQQIVKADNQKVIIFSQYREAIKRLEQALQKDYNLCLLRDFKNKFEASEYFNNNDDCKIILMTDEGNTGLNLPTASYVIHYDQNYSPAVMAQRSARAHRANTKHTVNVVNLICKNTIEERVLEAIDLKNKFSGDVLDEEVSELSLGNVLSTKELFNLL